MAFTSFKLTLSQATALQRCFLATLLSICAASSSPVQAQPNGPDTQTELLAETTSIQPGKPFTVGVRFKMEPEWHIYWQNPGDSGSPTRIEWTLPAGFKAGEIQWPRPHQFVMSSLVSYGYEDEVVLLTQITPPANLTPGKPVTLGADVKWLICSEQCVPQQADLSLRLDVKGEALTVPGPGAGAVGAAKAQLPVSATQVGFTVRSDATALKAGAKPGTSPARINLRFVPPTGTALSPERLKKAYFYVGDTYTLTHPTTQTVLKEGNGYRIPLTTADDAEPLKRLRGMLVVPTVDSTTPDAPSRGLLIDIPVAVQPAANLKAKPKATVAAPKKAALKR
jgi:DsbC/DsbD-like thiol-disulfide interchange protein